MSNPLPLKLFATANYIFLNEINKDETSTDINKEIQSMTLQTKIMQDEQQQQQHQHIHVLCTLHMYAPTSSHRDTGSCLHPMYNVFNA